jgi:Icc-related predicted phosphoesterase
MVKCFFIKTTCLLALGWLCCGYALSQRIAVIADTQAPQRVEMLWSENEHNTEATGVLFNRLLKEHVAGVFMLGDLVAMGSKEEQWISLDYFIAALRRKPVGVYAVPGNHDYSFPANVGIAEFYKRFPRARASVQVYTINSVAMVLVDVNFGHISREQKKVQAIRYHQCLDSLQNDVSVQAIIVCTHHAPYTNSTAVKSNKEVQRRLVPGYISTPKAVLFLSGHSHNMERFCEQGKVFLVVGGGGGLGQPLLAPERQKYSDLIEDEQKIRFFYVIIERENHILTVKAKGMQAGDFTKHLEMELVKIDLEISISNLSKLCEATPMPWIYDILLLNGKSIGIVEVKYKAHENDVSKVLRKAETFRVNFPEYAGHKIYLGLATLSFYPELEQGCINEGIAVVKQVGDTVVINDKHLKVF